MREWGHFNAVVLDRISAYPEFREGGAALRHALAVWARLLNDQQSRSALEYHQLERAEAETRGAELARVLDALRSGARMRGSAIEQLASGVRNDLQVVMTTGALESGQWHEAYALRKLSRESFNSIDEALTNMVTLAHLEAGHEVRRIEPFDAAPGLALLVEGFRHVASEAGITLDAAGPDSLPVCGDAERVRRVARHLLLCALRAPSPSPVVVRWHESPRADSRWHLLVEHAIAPGSADGGTEAGRALAASTDALQQVVGVAPTGNESALQNGSIPVGAGDGVDLLIAKHLCDVLGASIEVEADASVLRYRVSLPMTYA
jgi:signal transduction histidine kinase